MALPLEVIAMLNRVRARTGRPMLNPDGSSTTAPAWGVACEPDPAPGFVRLTRELILAGGRESGSGRTWNKAQLAAIGIGWDQLRHSGWIDRNAGRTVTQEAYSNFLALRKA